MSSDWFERQHPPDEPGRNDRATDRSNPEPKASGGDFDWDRALSDATKPPAPSRPETGSAAQPPRPTPPGGGPSAQGWDFDPPQAPQKTPPPPPAPTPTGTSSMNRITFAVVGGVAALIAAILVISVIGGGNEDDTGGEASGARVELSEEPSDEPATESDEAPGTAEGRSPDEQPGDSIGTIEDTDCPALTDAIAQTTAATYAMYGQNAGTGDQGDLEFIGTAWALEERLLITNAHVVEAFVDLGGQFERVLALRAGTREVYEVSEGAMHPAYNGDGTPDVGLFVVDEALPTQLRLAARSVLLAPGDELQIVGFPGDVADLDVFEVSPGESIPQATALTGRITALRAFDATEDVSVENIGIIQHQTPTTGGTSGSSMVRCGAVVGVNFGGTPDTAGANSFGIHVRHVYDLVGLFESRGLQRIDFPIEQEPPSSQGNGGDSGDGGDATTLIGTVGDPFPHDFVIELSDDGSIVGVSRWGSAEFRLSGEFDGDGSVVIIDDAPERSEEPRGIYAGEIADGTIEGIYFNEGDEETTAPWTARVAEE